MTTDKTQTKHAMYGLLTLLLIVLMIPFAIIGKATAPKLEAVRATLAEVTPRAAAMEICQRQALRRDPAARWTSPNDWIMSKHASGNYSLMMSWNSQKPITGMWQPTIARCVLQPVNGALQLVSLS